MRSRWLRGMTFRQFKKHIDRIENDGVYYKLKDYAQLMVDSGNVKIGDFIYNDYLRRDDKIVKIHRQWNIYGICGARVLQFIFETENGYLIYDINDRELCEAGSSFRNS